MDRLSTYLETIARETQKPEADMITMALETGSKQLWRERTLARYLRGEISRDDAVEAAGLDWVDLAGRQRQAALEDRAWAKSA